MLIIPDKGFSFIFAFSLPSRRRSRGCCFLARVRIAPPLEGLSRVAMADEHADHPGIIAPAVMSLLSRVEYAVEVATWTHYWMGLFVVCRSFLFLELRPASLLVSSSSSSSAWMLSGLDGDGGQTTLQGTPSCSHAIS